MGRRLAAIVGSAIFFVIAPGVVAGLAPYLISGWRLRPPLLGLAPIRLAGALLIILGLAALADSFARFAWQGLGTPAPPFPTRRLVVTGLYRRVRNPMYVAVTAAILGQGLLLGDLRVIAYGAVVWVLFHLFVVAYEEPTLRRSFGADYETFRANVPRWIPRLTPWREGGGAGPESMP